MNPKTAAKWIEAWDYCRRNSSVPAVLVAEAVKKYRHALKATMDKKPAMRLPRGKGAPKVKTSQAAKKDLRKELEALCKTIVFTRDCGSPEAREGNCITCGQWRVLQWGHFIRQIDSKYLVYHPLNSAGQCAGCNGPAGRGRQMEFAEALDKREKMNASAMLRALAAQMKGWRPNKYSLRQQLEELRRHPLAPKASNASPVSASEPEQSPRNTPAPHQEQTKGTPA